MEKVIELLTLLKKDKLTVAFVYGDLRQQAENAIKILEAFEECINDMQDVDNPREMLAQESLQIALCEFTNTKGQRIQILMQAENITNNTDEAFEQYCFKL